MRNEFYVYLHKDKDGQIFYVGKGIGRRAWDRKRHPAWQKYVSERLVGKFTVELYMENLSEENALEIEDQLINKYGPQLVNWVNTGRDFDYAALKKFHEMRDANRKFVAETKPLEKTNLSEAIERYETALDVMREYECMTLERGLIAELNVGPNWGDPNILDRLTLCLIKEKRYADAITAAERYFAEFPTAATMSAGKKILSRIEKIRSE